MFHFTSFHNIFMFVKCPQKLVMINEMTMTFVLFVKVNDILRTRPQLAFAIKIY